MLIRLISISFFITIMINVSFGVNPKSDIIGVWKYTRQFDSRSSKKVPLHYNIVFHFHDDGEVIVKDLKWGEESVWKWSLRGSLLTLSSKDGTVKKVGQVSFKSEDHFFWRGRNFLRM